MDAIQERELLRSYLVEKLREMTTGRRGLKAEIARKLGMSTAHMTNVTKHGRGVSDDVVDTFLAAFKITRTDLLEEALEWEEGRPAKPEVVLRVRETEARYGSELELVRELIVRKGEATAEEVDEAFAAAGHAARKGTEQLGIEETVREVMSWIRSRRRGQEPAQLPVEPDEIDAEERETAAAFPKRKKARKK